MPMAELTLLLQLWKSLHFLFLFPRGNIGDSSSTRAQKKAKLDNDDELTHLMASIDNYSPNLYGF
jgi:hypothetical protein